MVITALTRNFWKLRPFRPLKMSAAQGFARVRISQFHIVLACFSCILPEQVYGELSERSKVRHSKCRVPKRNLGFESLTLRQKPSHIKAFAHMTGLFFSLKVTSAYMIFGKSSGVPAGLPCVRQGQDIVHHICRGDLGLVIQMAVNIRRRANIAVTQPLLDLLQRHIVRQKQ